MPETASPPDDPEIRAERAHLAAARAELLRMHEEVVNLETPKSAAEDNDDYVVNLYYKWSRQRRAAALIDMPDVPLFFGRLDYEPGTVFDEADDGKPDRVYVGRRHVHEPGGVPLVIDWRAPIAVPFYRATRDDPQRVRLRRRYGFDDAAELTAYEDEVIGESDRTSDLLAKEIERPRRGPMRDIVATIQPEQDDLVRAPLDVSLCVQGAPGTGKTAVGLHRIAYLLYTESSRLAREGGVAIVGPNSSFLSYIRHVLPALGEVSVSQTTLEELIGTAATGPEEPPDVGQLKGDARMATVLRRALWLPLEAPDLGDSFDGLMYVKGASRYRVPTYEVEEIVASVRADAARYDLGRKALAQRLAHAVLVRMERRGESPDDRTQNAVARSKPVKTLVDRVWPKRTPAAVLYRLLADEEFLAAAAKNELSVEEQRRLQHTRPGRSAKSARWSPADIALLDELSDLIDRTDPLGHLVVDEAQDLSAMQLRALGRRCRTATVLGDLAQATTPWASTSWTEVAGHIGLRATAASEVVFTELARGFRVPAQIIDYAARLLPQIAPGLKSPVGVRTDPDSLRVTETSRERLADDIVLAAREALNGPGSVGVLAATGAAASIHQRLVDEGLHAVLLGETENALEVARLIVVPVALVKGLEFDTVVIAEPDQIVAAEPRGAHRLYVALTRAVSALHIVHTAPLPL